SPAGVEARRHTRRRGGARCAGDHAPGGRPRGRRRRSAQRAVALGDPRTLEARRHVSTLRLRTGGRTLAVTLAPDGDGMVATVDDASHRLAPVTATLVASIAGATVESLDVTIDGRQRRAVVARTRDRIHVALDGHVWVFERVDDAEHGGAGGAGSG